jgi:hypothetical protein
MTSFLKCETFPLAPTHGQTDLKKQTHFLQMLVVNTPVMASKLTLLITQNITLPKTMKWKYNGTSTSATHRL